MSMEDILVNLAAQRGVQIYRHDGFIRMDVGGDQANWRGYAVCLDEERLFVFYLIPEFYVPSDKIVDMALCLTRINYRLKAATFELNSESGEISCRVSQFILTEQEEEAAALMSHLIWTAAAAMDNYYQEILAVLHSH